MESISIKQKLIELRDKLGNILPLIKIPDKKQELVTLETRMQEANFWQNVETAQAVSQRHAIVSSLVAFWEGFDSELAELEKLVESNTDEGTETLEFLNSQAEKLEKEFAEHKSSALFSDDYDDHSAVLAIHAGAGGTDAQDWAEMLLRMYLRYAENKGFKVDIIEKHNGSEAGIKSALLEVSAPFAFGHLKSEAGVHRLVRLSPYNPSHTRETSFALVEVLPELAEAETIELDPKDLDIEAKTASGHGGQSVNTTYSAIRITHIPTGLKVSIQNERSQHQNKALAMKILSAKVQAQAEERKLEEKKNLRGEFKSAEWGNQIRSYVLHPYKLVKDHRTGCESTDPESVLDGKLDEFVEKYLEKNINLII